MDLTALIRQIKTEISLRKWYPRLQIQKYIFTYFRHAQTDAETAASLGETFFQNEVEYLLSGKPDDERAKTYVRRMLKIVRNGLNLAYLYSCPAKREAAMAAAQAISPGPAAALTRLLILESWALLEAENDLRILEAGERVPLIKQDDNWAISLENVLALDFSGDDANEGNGGGGKQGSLPIRCRAAIRPQTIEGQSYEAYLKIFVAALPQERGFCA